MCLFDFCFIVLVTNTLGHFALMHSTSFLFTLIIKIFCKQEITDPTSGFQCLNKRVIKRRLINGCPDCGRTIDICCADYVEFYSPKKKENKKEGEK